MTDSGLDALELEHLALRRGLPRTIAAALGSMVARSGLEPARRQEVLEEMIAHFEDGLAAGRAPAELLAEFGDTSLASPPEPLPVVLPRRGDRFVSGVARNIRYALRRLLASPGFSVVAILSLGLGIGATTAVFSLVNAVILRPSPLHAPEEVVELYESGSGLSFEAFTNPDLADVERGTRTFFSTVAGVRYALVQVDREGQVSPASAELVTGGYFSLYGLSPRAGRLLGPEDDLTPDGHAVAVLGHGYWQRAFGSASGVVGRTIRVNGRAYEIVGVAPAAYEGSRRGIVPDLIFPMMMLNHLNPSERDLLQSRSAHGMFARARLRPGVTLTAARAALAGVATELRTRAVGDWDGDESIVALPAKDVIIFPPVDAMLKRVAALLLVVVGLVVVVVCANLASFLLAKGFDRRKEIAVRLALGATRGTLLTQLLTESMLLGLAGGLAGLAIAVLLGQLLLSADLPLPLPLSVNLRLDGRVLAFASLVSLGAVALFGLIPALRASNPHLAGTLRDESAGGSRGRSTVRNGLVVAQVAVSLVLLVSAGLFIRSMNALRTVNPGFGRSPSGLLLVSFPPTRYPPERRLAEQRKLATLMGEIPGVTAVGMISNMHLNLTNTENTGVKDPATIAARDREWTSADVAIVDTGFFAAAELPLLSGRDFAASDGAEAPQVAIVNEALARRLWPGKEALDQRLVRGSTEYQVVGVASTAKIRTLGEEPRSAVYFPLAQSTLVSLWYLARVNGDGAATATSMLRAANTMDPELIPVIARSMERHIGVLLLPFRLGAVVLTALAGLAVVLATIGLYGTVSYAVAQRTREVGIRLALGADAGAMVELMTRGGLRLVVWGSVIGLALSLLLARGVSRLLFGVGPIDPVTFVVVPILLLAVAALATWLPARRVARVAPTEALRADG